ncbi:PREDICTED: metaxin-1 [Crocodylus porosus]|uniref:metaxin-1 n=1 Tax=Crocodylus porosus TaxID=8502 RepID=UPI00093F150B|nr:PREDICTED: metaxin-1 [Crocodylus porosus]
MDRGGQALPRAWGRSTPHHCQSCGRGTRLERSYWDGDPAPTGSWSRPPPRARSKAQPSSSKDAGTSAVKAKLEVPRPRELPVGWHRAQKGLGPCPRGALTCFPLAGRLPALKTREEGVLSKTQDIITHLRKQKYNADYDLSARQGADTLAFMCLLEEKLLPALIHTFWVDAKNYVEHTRKWYAEAIPFPLNFFLPNRMHKQRLERLQLLCGDDCLEDEERLEKLYHEARECLTLLSQRLGAQKFFFGDSPASLDAFIFSHLAPLFKAKLPNGKLQQHLKSLENLCNYCTSILSLYFPWDGGDPPATGTWTSGPEGGDSEEDPHKRRNQILSVLVALGAMISYALLSGIVSIQRTEPSLPGHRPISLEEEEEEEEE